MNKEELKRRAIILEIELYESSSKSPDVFSLSNFEPLVSAIRRAKAMEISKPEDTPGMYHWNFEADIFWKFKELGVIFSRFELFLRGLEF